MSSQMLPSSRLLPATISAIGVVLALKSVELVMTMPSLGELQATTTQALEVAGSTASTSMIGQAYAGAPPAGQTNQAQPVPAAPAAMNTAAPTPDAAGSSPLQPAAAPAQAAPAPALPYPGGAASPPAADVMTATAPMPSPAMDAVALRRSQLETRERAVDAREAKLAAADKALNARVAQLVALEARLQALQDSLHERDEANWAGMVKVYETMKPRDAANIFNSLDKPTLLELLDRMKPAKSALVLASMDPMKAREATQDLAVRRTQSTTAATSAATN
jgi:flagellar motility protein MotE (MotC chaperone)